MDNQTSTTFVYLTGLADQLGLPIHWLKAQARAGRIPHLDAGGVLLFNVPAVRIALAATAAQTITQPQGRQATILEFRREVSA